MDLVVIWTLLIVIALLIVWSVRKYLREKKPLYIILATVLTVLWVFALFNANSVCNILVPVRINVDCVALPGDAEGMYENSDEIRIIYVESVKDEDRHNALIDSDVFPNDTVTYNSSIIWSFKGTYVSENTTKVRVINKYMTDRINGNCTTGIELMPGEYYLVYGNDHSGDLLGVYNFLLEGYNPDGLPNKQNEQIKEYIDKLINFDVPNEVEVVLDEDQLEYFDTVDMFGEMIEIYYLPDSEEEFISFTFGDAVYSFQEKTLFVKLENFQSIEDYVTDNHPVYYLNKLYTEGVPITYIYELDETTWESTTYVEDPLEGVRIYTEYEVYPEGVEVIKVKWVNELNDPMSYGKGYMLEKFVDGEWKQVNRNDGFVFEILDIAIGLMPGEQWHEYSLFSYTTFATKGEYRIITRFHRDSLDGVRYTAGNFPAYNAVSYFEIGDEAVIRDFGNDN